MAPCAILVSRVLHVRNAARSFLVLDASSSDLSRHVVFGTQYHVSVLGKRSIHGRQYYDVVGKINSSSDCLAERCMLPSTDAGDFCVVHDVGAHCVGNIYLRYGYGRCGVYLRSNDGTVKLIDAPVRPSAFSTSQ
ncbi:MAG: hypothetical protein PHS97_00345 [Oscillospiraceae bacterium]|nr:hypothetical protein [Oscillospiraceae bacterium]